MFYKKKYCLAYLTYNTTKNYYNTGQCIILLTFLSSIQVNVYFFNTNTGLKKYTLTCSSIKKNIH